LRGWGQTGLGEPAANGPGTRQLCLRVVAAQDDADQFRPPRGVLVAQGPGLLDKFRWGGGAAWPATVVGRRRLASVTGLAEEMPDGARGQAEALG
jgi:hypothetical protein